MHHRTNTLALLLLLGLLVSSGFSQIWNATNDFVGGFNPNGPWSYGYGMTGTTFTPYTVWGPNCAAGLIYCWQPTITVLEAPTVAWNNTGNIINYGTVVIPPGLNVHPGPSVDTIVQWTAPMAGTFSVSGFFQIIDVSPTGIVGLVYKNGTVLYSEELLGPPAQHPDTLGGIETFSFSGLTLQAGDVLSFGVNNDGNFLFDSTHFDATVATPEPSSIVFLASGLLAGAGYLRRKHRG